MSDDLRDEVERLKKKIDSRAYQERKEEAGSWTHRTQEDLSALQSFLAAIGGFLRGLWEVVLPVGRGIAAVTPWLWRPVRALWNRLVYIEDEYKNRRLSKRRATYFVAASLVFAWFILVPLLGFLYDLGLYLVTVKHDEVVYLTNSQEILPDENVHSVQGCHELPCTDKNSFYFRIRATLFNEVWSVVHGRGLFFPDYVAASVPLSISQCTITSYGVRLKLIMRGMDIYPDLLKTECSPMTGDGSTAPAPSATQ
jgi:hypothetical protein